MADENTKRIQLPEDSGDVTVRFGGRNSEEYTASGGVLEVPAKHADRATRLFGGSTVLDDEGMQASPEAPAGTNVPGDAGPF